MDTEACNGLICNNSNNEGIIIIIFTGIPLTIFLALKLFCVPCFIYFIQLVSNFTSANCLIHMHNGLGIV